MMEYAEGGSLYNGESYCVADDRICFQCRSDTWNAWLPPVFSVLLYLIYSGVW